jgi:VIT1/CCC1 family predicted Fe2+/Mn2+ transporter
MKVAQRTLWLGAWLIVVPFLGLPGAWKERLVVATGLALFLAALYSYYSHSHPRKEAIESAPANPSNAPKKEVEKEAP